MKVDNSAVTKRPVEDRIFDTVNYILLTLILVAILYPLYFVVIASVSDPAAIYRGEVIYKIKDFTLGGYQKILEDSSIWWGYLNSIFYLIFGTSINIVVTVPTAYALSRKDLNGRNFIMLVFTFTLFFSGGLIPTYLLVRNLGLYNTRWIMLLMNTVVVFNLIVCRTFFQSIIPDALLDAARIDGCSDFQFFFRIVLPVSKAIIAVMVLYYGVMHWNTYFTGLIYLKDKELYPLQLILRDILTKNQVMAEMMAGDESFIEQQKIADQIKYGVIIVASVPMLILYPFVQKYFVQGVMIGSIKG